MKAYEENEKYIFVSYSHIDRAVVIPIIDQLQSVGFRVWYDLGIEAGTEWPAYIESRIDKCARIIAFISPAAVESVNCRNEINYALMKRKEMLVIYLEETELKYGLSLQLNAIQSLFRNRHSSDQSFYRELINAQVLQCCKTDNEEPSDGFQSIRNKNISEDFESILETGNRNRIKIIRSSNTPAIATVGTIPSNDPTNAWPIGIYSQIINEDEFQVIHFHCKLIKPIIETADKKIGIMIFDSEDSLVYDYRSSICIEKENDRFSVSWIITDSEGLKQKTGDYTAIIWIDESRVFEHSFRIISNKGIDDRSYKPGEKNLDEIERIKNKLAYPKVAKRHIISSVCGTISYLLFSAATGEISVIIFGLFFLSCAIWAYISTWRLSYKHVIQNKIGNAVAMIVGYIHYGIFLVIIGAYAILKRKEWKKKLIEYGADVVL